VSVYLKNSLNGNLYYLHLKKILFIVFILLTINIGSYAAEPDTNTDISIEPYFTQSIHLKWQDDINFSQNSANENDINNSAKKIANMPLQGLIVPEAGIAVKADRNPNYSFCLDFSVDAQIYDIYNIRFAPINFNLKKAYLTYRTDFLNKFLDDGIELQIGRDELLWGPSQNLDIRAPLDSFSSIAEDLPWDMLKYSGSIKLFENQKQNNNKLLNFSRVLSIFDNNWLIGQRFEYYPDNKWRLGLTEATFINNFKNSSIIYFNPLPIPLFNYLARQIAENELIIDKPEIEKNNYHNIGFDITWYPENNLQLYTEIILYDLTVWEDIKSSLNPTNYGLTIGGYFSDIFTNKDKNTDLSIEYNHLRVTEEANVFSASLIHDITDKCQIELIGTIKNSSNIDNQLNEKLQELTLNLEIQYRF